MFKYTSSIHLDNILMSQRQKYAQFNFYILLIVKDTTLGICNRCNKIAKV